MWWQEFKEFAFKGNAFDLAVGVIIGAAFSRIVDSIVNHLIMACSVVFASLTLMQEREWSESAS